MAVAKAFAGEFHWLTHRGIVGHGTRTEAVENKVVSGASVTTSSYLLSTRSFGGSFVSGVLVAH